jgi:hypothetical protein
MSPRIGGGPAVLLALASIGCAERASAPPLAATPTSTPATAAAPAARDGLDDDGIFPIVSGCGLRIAVNDGDAHFSIDLDGSFTHAEQEGDLPYLVIDDVIVQIVHVSHAQLDGAGAGKRGLDLLRAHEAWESAYLAEQLHAKVEPRELSLEARGQEPRLEGILWWFPVGNRAGPDGVAIHRYWAYATVEVGEHVVGLSARAERGLEPMDLMQRLARWMATLRQSDARLSPRAMAAEIRDAPASKDACPDASGAVGIDRRLRLDKVPRDERDALGRAAEASGGVERQVVGNRLRYRNHVCRFELTYPDDRWADFLVRDVAADGCLVNVTTPLVYDAEAKEKITNAVVLTVARTRAGYGPDEMHADALDMLKKKGAALAPAKKALLEGALDTSYTADDNGTHYEGEVATVRRGALLYTVHFNATRGTIAEGRKHLARWLAGLRLDVP